MPEVSRAYGQRPQADQQRVDFFFYGIALKGPKILHRMIKLTLAVIALVIGIHHIFFTFL